MGFILQLSILSLATLVVCGKRPPPPPPPTCHWDEHQCPNKVCIPKSCLCDGNNDCGDNTDEQQDDCPIVPIIVPECPFRFQCPGGDCIPFIAVCDHVYDCEDGTDELDCPTDPPCPASTHFQCPGGACIPNSKKCDGVYDCGDRADEKDCPTPDCKDISHRCAKNAHQCKTHSLVKKNCKKTCDLCEPLW